MSKKAAVFYGRMNPFTRGHLGAVTAITQMANHKPFVVVSHTQNTKKNPFSAAEKQEIIREIVGNGVNIVATSKNQPHLHRVLRNLKNQGYNNIKVFLGSNRIPQFAYLRNIEGVNLVQFGNNRTNNGVSATRARTAAIAGNRNTFRNMMPVTMSNATRNRLMATIQERMAPKRVRPSTASNSTRNEPTTAVQKRRR
jgi:nicotinamide mononucleotide adenylyltransferase